MTSSRAAVLCMVLVLAGCAKARRSQGERLARMFCAGCHAFPEPALLPKTTWQSGALPKMAPRLGVSTGLLYALGSSSPYMTVVSPSRLIEAWVKDVANVMDC